MRRCESYDILAVPFPYVERPVVQRRPALVIATDLGPQSLLWVLMITSATNAGWAEDVLIPEHQAAGLPIPSVVRTAKVATVTGEGLKRLGRIDRPTAREIDAILRRRLSI